MIIKNSPTGMKKVVDVNAVSKSPRMRMRRFLVKVIFLSGHKFTNLHVYETEGKSQINLYDNYKLLTPKEDQLGWTTFLDVIKLLTKRREAKAGLSKYYTSFRHAGTQFFDLIVRLTMFGRGIDNCLLEFISNVKNNWLDIYDFLTWRYAKSHLSCNTKDAIHCYHYTLDAK